MSSNREPVPDSVRQWFEARHPGARLAFNDVDLRIGLDPENFGSRMVLSGWFEIQPTGITEVPGGRVRFFQAFVSRVDGALINASEHRPTPVH
jgi:hypothetical protein